MIRTAPYRPLPYYRWFWQDWRANRNVQRMSYVERGLYRELLDECWAEGFIPSDLQDLADICDCPIDVMTNAWPRLERCFDIDSDGKLVNTRLNIERTEKDTERVKRSEAGKKGGSAKPKTTETKASTSTSQASASKCLANASTCHIEGVLVLEGEEDRKEAYVPDAQSRSDYFDRFWKLYPKKKSKADAEKAWSKVKMSEEFFAVIIQSLSDQCSSQDWTKEAGKYVPLAGTWIRGKRWEDEVSPAAQQKHNGFAQADYTAGVNFDERGNVIL